MASRFSPRILGALWLFGVASLAWAAPPLDLSHETDIPRLVQLLGSEDNQTSFQAAIRLRELRGPQLVAPIVALLADPKAAVRANVVWGIGLIFHFYVPQDPRLTRAVLPLLHDPDAAVLRNTVSALWQLADLQALEPLRQLAGETTNPLRRDALGALGSFHDPRAIAVLAAALRDPDAQIRSSALRSLSMIHHPLATAALADRLQEIAATEDVTALADYVPDPRIYIGLGNEARDMARELANSRDTPALLTTSLFTATRPAARAVGALLLAWQHDLRAVEPLVLLLHDPDDSVRWAAAHALANVGDVRALDPLLAALATDTPHVQAAVAGALGAIGDRRACDPLAHLLATPDDALRGAVGLALARLGDGRAFDAVLPLLQHADPHRRAQAAAMLGLLGDARALEALATTVNDPYNVVRVQGIRALGHLRDPRATVLLLNAMQQAQLGKPLVEEKYGDQAEILNCQGNLREPRVEAVQALGEGHDPRAFESLLAAMTSFNGNEDLSETVPQALAHYTDPRVLAALTKDVHDGAFVSLPLLLDRGANGIYALQQLLFDPTFTSRMNYMSYIGALRGETLTMFMDDPRMLEALLGMLKRGDESVLNLLAELKDPETVDVLLDVAQRRSGYQQERAIDIILVIQRAHPDEVNRAQVIRVLTEIAKTAPPDGALPAQSALLCLGQREAIPALLAALHAPQLPRRRAALSALRDAEDPEIVEAVLAALHDPEPSRRQLAVFFLGATKSPRIRQALLAYLWDADFETRRSAVLSILSTPDPDTLATLLGWLTVANEADRRMLSEGLARWQSPEAVGVLCGLLHDPALTASDAYSPCPRIQAARSLAALGDVRAVEPLIAALDDGPLVCRQAMAEALGHLKDRRAVPPLITALERFSGDARHTAAVALTTLTGQTLGDDPAKWRAWWQQAADR
ncbi:MAG TPA: HEAT repeat domain-containing protein [Armatimonadota bacterium]|jgi:HEAT repeat protein